MTTRNLDYLFRPTSIAVIGASNQPGSIGEAVMRNLLGAGFTGPIMPVNPRYKAVAGVLAYPDVAALPETPDLAIVGTPPITIPDLVHDLGVRGTRAAIVLTTGLERERGADGRLLQRAMLDAARPHLLRILGPNSVGLMSPGIALNASYVHTGPLPGKLAFVTESGGLATAVLDFAASSGIGFSHFVSVGRGTDVDIADVLDYMSADSEIAAVLLYMETPPAARKFVSAARAAARSKPVLVVKAGRSGERSNRGVLRASALAHPDAVFDAVVQRSGLLRVDTIPALFDAVETLARTRPLTGDRLAIVCNGTSPGVMAADALARGGGELARLSATTLDRLSEVLPDTWPRANPVDIEEDAPPNRQAETLDVLLEDSETDAVLFIHEPVAIVDSEDVARVLVDGVVRSGRTVLACWLGRRSVERARQVFADAGIPTYDSPEQAVNAFLQMVAYRRSQQLLMQTPNSAPEAFVPDVAEARAILGAALEAGREVLSEPEAKAVLAAYGVPIVETAIGVSPDEAVRLADAFGYPVALKILSPDIPQKSDVGGVALDLGSGADVAAAAAAMQHRVRTLRPEARLTGFSVQRMARRPDAHELFLGATVDPAFGPVLVFGHGGTAVDVIQDFTVALPPLNPVIADSVIARTRVARLLAGRDDRPGADMAAVRLSLMQLAHLVADLPEIVEIDVNPLIADATGVAALDARMRIAPANVSGPERLAIRPYPKELEEQIDFGGRTAWLRPIRPEDAPRHQEFFSRLTPEDVRYRFFTLLRQLAQSELSRFTQIDYNREMAFIASAPDPSGEPETLGVVRIVTDPDRLRAEFAIVVRSDLKGCGLGRLLLEKMIRYCRLCGIRELVSETLEDNRAMRGLARNLGFTEATSEDGDTVILNLPLNGGS